TTDNLDTPNLDFIGAGAIKLRQYGDVGIDSNNVPSYTPQWGKELKKNLIYYANLSLNVWYTPISMSYLHNYVDLDPTYKDDFGDPLLRVTFKFTDQERNIAKFGVEKCHDILEEMDADITDEDEVSEEFDNIFYGAHHTG